MKDSGTKLGEKLSKNLHPVNIISGDEILLVQEAFDLVCKTAKRQGFQERIIFEPKLNIDWEQLHLALNTLSLFNEKRILVVRIPTGKPGDIGAKVLIDISSTIHPDNLILITLPKLNKSIKSSKWFKAISNILSLIHI